MVYNIDSFDLFRIHRDISRVFDGMFTILVFLMIDNNSESSWANGHLFYS